MQITNLNQLDLNKSYNYLDYLSWKFSERVELLKGKIFAMSPAPNSSHQRISFRIEFQLYSFLNNEKCEVFHAPFDVRLQRNVDEKQIINVVQPDICVICDETKIDEKGCLGAPDLVIEILSPGNTNKEMKYKFELYEAAGVKEYWIVDPMNQNILQYFLKNEAFVNHKPLIIEDTIYCKCIEGFSMPLEKIFIV